MALAHKHTRTPAHTRTDTHTHTHTHFGSISLQLFLAVIHLLDDEVGPRVFSQVVVISYHPAPLGVPLLLPINPQQQGRLIIVPLEAVHGDVITTHFLDARSAHAVASCALTHHMPGILSHLTLTPPAHQLPGLMDL